MKSVLFEAPSAPAMASEVGHPDGGELAEMTPLVQSMNLDCPGASGRRTTDGWVATGAAAKVITRMHPTAPVDSTANSTAAALSTVAL